MFTPIEENGHIKIRNNLNPYSLSSPKHTFVDLKTVSFIGENDPFENYFHKVYWDVKSLTFNGKLLASFPADEAICEFPFDIYELEDAAGYAFHVHHEIGGKIEFSRSFNMLINSMAFKDLNARKVLEKDELGVFDFDGTHSINNDFSTVHIGNDDINEADHAVFDLSMCTYEGMMNINAIIDTNTYKVIENPYFTEYSADVLNLGRFSLTRITPDLDRYPDFFPLRHLDGLTVITDLIIDNAKDILVPKLMCLEDYETMIENARLKGKICFSYCGMHNGGYFVQADIEILDSSISTPTFSAKVNRLVLSNDRLIMAV